MLLLEGVQLLYRLVASLAPMTVTVDSTGCAVATCLETDFSAGPSSERAALAYGTNAGFDLDAIRIRYRLSAFPRAVDDFGVGLARSSFEALPPRRRPPAHGRLRCATRLRLTSRADALRFSRPDGPGRTRHPTERRSSTGSAPGEIPACA